MKKVGILLILYFLLVLNTKANHILGGEIALKQLNDSTYTITLSAYRDATGIPFGKDIDVSIKNDQGLEIGQATLYLDTANEIYSNGNPKFGVIKEVFVGNYVFSKKGTFLIEYNGLCRPTVFNNVQNQLLCKMSIETQITVFPNNEINNTPKFLNDICYIGSVNNLIHFNPLPFDEDGDSLVWRLDTPRYETNTVVPNYTNPVGSANYPFKINNLNGEIAWEPLFTGAYIFVVHCDEYRNGVKIGFVRREAVIVIQAYGNNLPSFSTSNNVQRINNINQVKIDTTMPVTVFINSAIPDSSDLHMSAIGEPLFIQNEASYVFFRNKGIVMGKFSWAPSANEIRLKPYLVVFRSANSSGNKLMVHDYTLSISVTNFTSTQHLEKNSGQLMIANNPSRPNELINFIYNNPQLEPKTMKIVDIEGKLVYELPINALQLGKNQIIVNPNLNAGIYFVQIIGEKSSNVIKFIIQ